MWARERHSKNNRISPDLIAEKKSISRSEHWTAHDKRLARVTDIDIDTKKYELVNASLEIVL